MQYKIGAVQPPDIQNDIHAAVATITRFMAEADRQHVTLLCFPECFLQGYTLDETETKQRALSLESQEFKNILSQLSKYTVAIVLGIIEEDSGNHFNTAVVISGGKLVSKYRKVNLFETNFQAGNDHAVFTINGLPFGINICYDARFPEGATEMASKGAKVLFYLLSNRWPTAKAKKCRYKHIPNLVDRAIESGCWVVSSDITCSGAKTVAYGCGAVVNPEGDVVTRVPELTVGMTSYTISL
jgi:predicted amidohydrolase